MKHGRCIDFKGVKNIMPKNIMKIFIVLCLLFFSRCEFSDEYSDYNFPNLIEVTSTEDALSFVYNHMSYVPDSERYHKPDYWQFPEESFLLKTGDCEDYTIFFMYLLHEKLGLDTHIIFLAEKENPIWGHAICFVNNKYYDPSTNYSGSLDSLLKRFYVKEIVSYDDVINFLIYYHRG